MKSFTLSRIRPYGTRCVLYGLLVVASVLFTMATALSVADFLRILFGEGEQQSHIPSTNLVAQWLDGIYLWLITFGKLGALLIFSAIIFTLYSLKNIFSYLSALEISVVRTSVVRDLRNALFEKAMRLPPAYYARHRKGDILARFGSDMAEYDENTLGSIQALSTAVVSMVLYLAMLFYLNVKLTLFVLCMLPLVAVVIAGLSHRLKRKSSEVQEMNSHLISMTDEAIGGLKVIKAYNAAEYVSQRFHRQNRAYAKKRTSMFRRIYSASPISDTLGNAIVVGILLFGSRLVMGGDQGLTAELFISYVMLFVLMIPPAKELSTSIAQIRKGRACADRIQAFLNKEEEDYDGAPTPATKATSSAMVELRNVSFAYDAGEPVLNRVSLTIPRGATVALVGPSGSGKTTIASLICRFHDPTGGEILFDGHALKELPLKELRQHIGVVPQESILFNDTIAANIAFANPQATMQEVEAAARAAQAHDFIKNLPQGYMTNIGDGGNLLSGGQRQRLCIARAILAKPELLILDEATSALDNESERLLQVTLDGLLRERTALVIAHRLSTVMGADRVVVMEHGRVVESGTPAELLTTGGHFARMVKLQEL